MAFRKLHTSKKVGVAFCGDGRDLNRAHKAGWKLPFFGAQDAYRARMSDHPFDFLCGFEWGVDLVLSGSDDYTMVHPRDLAGILMREAGVTEVDHYFLPGDIKLWVERFNEAERSARARKF
jgi:hypothetical protein